MNKNLFMFAMLSLMLTIFSCTKEELLSDAEITSFVILIDDNEFEGVVNSSDKTVIVELPYGTDATDLEVSIEVSEGAEINPVSGTKLDFTQPVEFTVTAENSDIVTYEVSVTEAAPDYKHDFESLSLGADTMWNGPDTRVSPQQVELWGTMCTVYYGSFEEGNASFENTYNETWYSWHGFAYSNLTDTETTGYTNQGSVYAPLGETYGNNFAVAYASEPITVSFTEPEILQSISLANSTYAALSMKNGDGYAEPFADGDYFIVKMTLTDIDDRTYEHSVSLADFTNGNSIISDKWQTYEFDNTKAVKSLTFSIDCSDSGTPSYFCFDNIIGLKTDE